VYVFNLFCCWDHCGNYLLANTPHNPIRVANTIGLVIERVRPEESLDRLRWYCSNPVHTQPTVIREDSLHVTDLGTQLKPVIERWINDKDVRKCPHCGVVANAKVCMSSLIVTSKMEMVKSLKCSESDKHVHVVNWFYSNSEPLKLVLLIRTDKNLIKT